MRKFSLSVIICSLLLVTCSKSDRQSPVNLSHALRLVDSIAVNEERINYIAIYADYPDYKPVAAKGEGIACVDDVGRFLEVLENEILVSGNRTLLPTAIGLTKFLLYMCRADGLWYNFLETDGRINTTHINSQADFGWWATRGIRGLTAAHLILKKFPGEAELLGQVDKYLRTTLKQMDADLSKYAQTIAGEFGPVPGWLIKSAPDMNSELLLALCKLQRSGDFELSPAIQKIAEGLVGFQFRREGHPLDGLYFCWQNSWHDWGANQPLALVEAFKITGDSTFCQSVQIWADNFVPFLIKHNLPREIILNGDGSYRLTELPQIAYGVSALYSGIQAFADLSGEIRYQRYAARIFKWFDGDNPAQIRMYWPETGVTFDGIDEDKTVNRNSGAESTIEGLLAHQRNFYRKQSDKET